MASFFGGVARVLLYRDLHLNCLLSPWFGGNVFTANLSVSKMKRVSIYEGAVGN